jgi:transposase
MASYPILVYYHTTNLKGGPVFALITSIPGVGMATATEVILATDEFNAITDPKKLAAWAGPTVTRA